MAAAQSRTAIGDRADSRIRRAAAQSRSADRDRAQPETEQIWYKSRSKTPGPDQQGRTREEFDGLNNLKELDLSNNAIASISALIGSQEESGILKKLEVLDLSGNEALNNSVWSFLGGLSSIKTVDLSFNIGLHGAVHNKDLRNLSNIETLLMDFVILDDVLPYIRVMTSLQVLSLTSCDSKRISSIEGLCELKKLRELDITQSSFGDTLPWCLANLTSLRLLDITSNHFTGNIARSPLINLTSLEYLAISNNHFEVPISFKSFFNHSKLVFIESLNNTLLEEEDFLATSPSFQLIGLCLSNSEHGHITRSFPRFLYHQHDLILVELSHFTGKFPYWLFDNNTRMETFILSYNSFSGPLLLPSCLMRNLIVLDISNNHLEGFLPYKIAGPFPSLEVFNMSTNNFEGNIPSSFGDMTSLEVLDLSNNKLSGKIPVHLAEGCPSLRFLSLSTNNLTGPVLPHQNNLTALAFLYSDNNGFTEIPSGLSRSSLILLDVSANQLIGKIPGFIGNISLWFLVMAGNHLEGPIPIEFCQLKHLIALDLSENNITGAVPSCFSSSPIYNIRLSKNRLDGPFPMAFRNHSTNLVELDLSYNQFSGNIPTWIGSFSDLEVLLLQHNHFEGNIPKVLCNLSILTMIDLSFNNLFGSIPPCISRIEFNGMHNLFNGFGTKFANSRHIFKLLLHDLGMVLDKTETDQAMSLDRSTRPEFVEFATKGMVLRNCGLGNCGDFVDKSVLAKGMVSSCRGMEYLQHLLMRSLWVLLMVMLAVENGCNGCLEKERIALLQLKDSINFPNGTSLPSWEEDDNTDCCHWERVKCNSTTRRVIKLELYRARDYWRIDGYWHLNASILLPFESLRSLNLSWNQLRSFVRNEGMASDIFYMMK
ncbi:hypothetical protein C3L33_05269, partial [Rhododendron williamsianum]